ncbi:TolC family protein [Thermoflavifilum thermophilum]|uniref:Outer membrane protein TolC n=1 Tax=Thermoflavifilum thermophilum TaxID=1393122 RepID=A0A1I7NDC7_9BACT|nr:TolC family protein [Thermoflavifilum thermophilum]SFV32556.1 Outer membrane protein TolC [Thermoflavifilum thermophilum]
MKSTNIGAHNLFLFLAGCLLIMASTSRLYAQGLSLAQIIDSIDRRNVGLQQYVHQQEAARHLTLAAQGWPAPAIGLGLNEFPYPGMSKTENLSARKMSMLRFQQMLPLFGYQRAEAAYQRSLVPQYADQQGMLRNTLHTRARMAYVEMWIGEQKIHAMQEQIRQLKLLIQVLEKQLSYNRTQPQYIYQARAALADWQNRLTEWQGQVAASTALLNSLMNKPVDAPLQIDTSRLPLSLTIPALLDSVSLLQHRSDLRWLSHQMNSLAYQREALLAQLKPQVGLSWDNMRMANGMYMYNLMVMITLPSLPWAARTQRQQAISLNEEVKALKDQQQEQLFEALGQIAQSQTQLDAWQKQLQTYETDILPAYAHTYTAYLQALAEQIGPGSTGVETLQAWNEWTLKKIDYLDLLHQYFLKKIELLNELEQ